MREAEEAGAEERDELELPRRTRGGDDDKRGKSTPLLGEVVQVKRVLSPDS